MSLGVTELQAPVSLHNPLYDSYFIHSILLNLQGTPPTLTTIDNPTPLSMLQLGHSSAHKHAPT